MVVNGGKKRMAVRGLGITDTEAVCLEVLGAPVADHPFFSNIISANLT